MDDRAERLGPAVLLDVPRGRTDDLQGVGLTLLAGLAPRGDPVAAEYAADRLGVGLLERGDVEPELEAGPPPRHPQHPVAEDPRGQFGAVLGGGDGDAGVGVQVVDVDGVDEAVHGGVDGRRGAALAVQAEVERGDHLVLALDARIGVGHGAQPVEAQDREPFGGERAQVAARALHPHELDVAAGHGVALHPLGGGVAAREVGVARVRAEGVRPVEQLGNRHQNLSLGCA